jgi:hypothetical protein
MTATGHDQKTLSAIFGKPDLPPGENRDTYQLLLSEVEDLLQPENILDALRVREITDAIWESQRFKRMSDGLIGTGHRRTLELLLDDFGCSDREGTSIAIDYYGADPQRRQAAAARLKAYGITEDQIHAKALGRAAKDMDLFDRLITNRGITRRALLKEHERQQKRAAKTKPAHAATEPPPEQTEPVKAKANPFPSPTFPPGYQ